ncbi:patatin-like phospholipase family protein [Legionella quateirensis]|uniref:Patatin-like phospholipase n=1 Tax=Legionella quateirensis TaxID=45072 RepID=A0A378KPN0_9GAMM|nr:patatin-like phospholipase family protein [Legionella quateirensis]KTD44628.1 patatin-like phospholipase [Legionella quateirensis]STY16854.1 patatin-like phospholipase [Legionella quateirensis]
MKKMFVASSLLLALILLFVALMNNISSHILEQNTVYPVKGTTPSQQASNETICPKEYYTILTIDGGGTRGLIPLAYLKYLEQQNPDGIASIFNLMGGISTGAIITAALSKEQSEHSDSYHFTAKQISDLYRKKSPDFFSQSLLYRIISLNGLILPLFNSQNKNDFFKEHFKNSTLKNLSNHVALFAYDIKHKNILIFCNWIKCDNSLNQYSIADIVSGATSVMGIFAPIMLSTVDHQIKYDIADLGLIINNPAYMTTRLASKICPNVHHYVVLSLGTGNYPEMSSNQESYHWGLYQWMPNLIAAATETNSQAASEYLSFFMVHEMSTIPTNQLPKLIYIRLNPVLDWNDSKPFATSPENLDYFEKKADEDIKKNKLLLQCIATIRIKDELTPECKQELLNYIHIQHTPYFANSLQRIFKD